MSERKRIRTLKACNHCRRRKVKCNGGSPCQNCSKYASDCEYTNDSGKKRRRRTKKELMEARELERMQQLQLEKGAIEASLDKLVADTFGTVGALDSTNINMGFLDYSSMNFAEPGSSAGTGTSGSSSGVGAGAGAIETRLCNIENSIAALFEKLNRLEERSELNSCPSLDFECCSLSSMMTNSDSFELDPVNTPSNIFDDPLLENFVNGSCPGGKIAI